MTGVQTCALPISAGDVQKFRAAVSKLSFAEANESIKAWEEQNVEALAAVAEKEQEVARRSREEAAKWQSSASVALSEQFQTIAALGAAARSGAKPLSDVSAQLAGIASNTTSAEVRTFALDLQRTASEWIEILLEADIPVGPIHDFSQEFSDPQVVHRGLRQEVPHHSGIPVPLVANPIRFTERPIVRGAAPPRLGEHTDAVLKEDLGLGEQELARLRAQGVI